MPRITAGSIPEHVARQEQRVFDAAITLFVERGYEDVSFADIADEVGLARNSLYRYFTGKAEILIRWSRIELEARIAHAVDMLEGPGDPAVSIGRWVDDQLDYAARPEHRLMTAIAGTEPALAAETRGELFGPHSRLLAPLRAALAHAGVADAAAPATAELINGLVLTAARYESFTGSPDQVARELLHRAITALVT